ncbi:MAG TPA: acetolactate synthase small subunit [Acidimicrobiales bacterium]|nr:acetolactate synthase small subunit [Acidimicrobiales bacterium]
MSATPPSHHLVALRVENKAGVLVRVAGLFARRGFNIVSLAVAPTDDERFSRISIVVDAASAPLQQVVDQLDKLINVVWIRELAPAEAEEAELLLATVAVSLGSREAVHLEAVSASAGAEVVDSDGEATTVRLAGTPETLDAFEDELRAYRIVELQRTGRIALPKLSRRGATERAGGGNGGAAGALAGERGAS